MAGPRSATIRPVRSPHSTLPHPSSRAGRAARAEFVAAVKAVMGTAELLWLPKPTDSTTATEESRNADTITWDADVSSRGSVRGSGLALDFDGIDDEGDTPDSDDHSFGDGAVDEAFSVFALINPDAAADTDVIIAKLDIATTAREWAFWRTSGDLTLDIWDESAAGRIGQTYASDLTAGAWTLVAGTYDGSGASAGVKLHKDGSLLSAATRASGSYTAMENTTATLDLAHRENAGDADLFDGKIAMVGLCRSELTPDDVDRLIDLVNAFFDLSL